MKKIVLVGYNSFNADSFWKFVETHKLANQFILVDPHQITDAFSEQAQNHCMHLLIPFTASEEHEGSVTMVERRNPGLEQRILDYPQTNVNILYKSTADTSPLNVLSLAMTFPEAIVYAVHGEGEWDGYFDVRIGVGNYKEANPTEVKNIHFISLLIKEFDIIDFDLLARVGIVDVPKVGNIDVKQI